MPKPTKSVLAADGTFALDVRSAHGAWLSVAAALDAWYQALPAQTPTVWVSAQLGPSIVWLLERRCRALAPPVKVFTETRARETGRVA